MPVPHLTLLHQNTGTQEMPSTYVSAGSPGDIPAKPGAMWAVTRVMSKSHKITFPLDLLEFSNEFDPLYFLTSSFSGWPGAQSVHLAKWSWWDILSSLKMPKRNAGGIFESRNSLSSAAELWHRCGWTETGPWVPVGCVCTAAAGSRWMTVGRRCPVEVPSHPTSAGRAAAPSPSATLSAP